MKRSHTGQVSGEDADPNVVVKPFRAKKSKTTTRILPHPSANYNVLHNVFSTVPSPEVYPATVVHCDSNPTNDPSLLALTIPDGPTSQEVPDFLHSSSDDDRVYIRNDPLREREMPAVDICSNPMALGPNLSDTLPTPLPTISPSVPSQLFSILRPPDAIHSPIPAPTPLLPSVGFPSPAANLLKPTNAAQASSRILTSPIPARCLTKAEVMHLQSRGASRSSPIGTSPANNPECAIAKPATASLPIPHDREDESVPADPRRFVCGSCPARFSRRANLNRHQLVHTRDRPFKCPLCSQVFSLYGNLKRHVSNVHETDMIPPRVQ